MKRIALLLLSIIPLLSHAQEGFSVDDGALVWRQVYQKETDAQTVAQNLRASRLFYDITTSEDVVTAELRGLFLDYKALGYKRMSLPLYVVNDTYSAFVMVQIRDGRYRVTVERIKAHNSHYGDSDLEDFALKKGELDPKFMQAPARIIAASFDNILSKLDNNTSDDEW